MDAIFDKSGKAPKPSELSYKFQRLREKIRLAVASGDLSGKLPGERALARRFHVNAKTLSKALTDLAAEGLLDRSIGRGTYVRGTEPAPASATGKWLIVCDAGEETACVVRCLREICPELETVIHVEQLRPSFLNQFSAVIDLAGATPEPFLRQLLVRNMPLVCVNREPGSYSTHSVLVDTTLGVSRVARDLLLAGHRRFGAIERPGRTEVTHALQQAVARYEAEATVETADASEAADLVEAGASALICGSVRDARAVRAALSERNIQVPDRVSLAAVGCACADAACSGYFVECEKVAGTVAGLLKTPSPRPVTLWLAGCWIDRRTVTRHGAAMSMESVPPMRISGVEV